LINADGQTVLTYYRNGRKPDKTLHVYSVTKSVISALIGIALDEKLIRTSTHPRRAPAAPSSSNDRRHGSGDAALLMTMSAGF
jgi:hypothetical protein